MVDIFRQHKDLAHSFYVSQIIALAEMSVIDKTRVI
jgi:hypothetical protein